MKKVRTVKNMIIFSVSITSLALALLTGCAVSFQKDHWDLPDKAPSEVSVMSFNMENLFDTVHTEGHEDYTFLPAAVKQADPKMRQGCLDSSDSAYRRDECLSTNWTEEALQKKLTNISKVVLGVDGNGPDNLLIMEIESDRVLTQLNKEHLQAAHYTTQVIIDGPDKRGINVAFLSRLPLVGTPVLHPIPWKPKNDDDKKWMERSRRILEVTVKAPNGDPMTFFVAHFPSQSNPTYWREQEAQFLAELVKAKTTANPNAIVIAGGDLNITHEEEEESHIFKNILSPAGAVSHFVGCEKCPGSHNYKKSWSFLDAQIYGKPLLTDGAASYELEPKTIDVIRYNPVHLKKGKYPARWDYESQTGVSDHFPLYARLKQRSAARNPVKEEVAATENSSGLVKKKK